MGVLIGDEDLPALRSSGRWWVEQAKLKHYFPGFGLRAVKGVVSSCAGALCTNWGGEYPVEIVGLADYPYAMPQVFVEGLARTPHMWKAGNICYLNERSWRPERCTLVFVLGKVAIYLNKCEIYRREGRWPGVEELH